MGDGESRKLWFLLENNFKFFIQYLDTTGEHAELHPDIIERMSKEGHLIGNHTYSHIQLTKNNREKFKDELIKTNEILKEITGEEVQ